MKQMEMGVGVDDTRAWVTHPIQSSPDTVCAEPTYFAPPQAGRTEWLSKNSARKAQTSFPGPRPLAPGPFSSFPGPQP
jgi:hypothetical protein